MFVFIIFFLIVCILFILIANASVYFISYWISLVISEFSDKNKKLVQGLSHSTILLALIILGFVYSYKGCTYVDRFSSNNDNMPVIGGWILFISCSIGIIITFFIFVFAFDDPEKQKQIEAQEKFEKEQELSKQEQEQNQEKSKQEAKRLADFNALTEKFLLSSEYKYIEQFAKRFGSKANDKDYLNLQKALANRQWNFSIDESKKLISEEIRNQKIENLKSKIFADNPHNRHAILKAYLTHFQIDNNVFLLAEILQERYSSDENFVALKEELSNIAERIELENFERRLAEEDEQISLEEIDNFTGYEFEDFLKTLFSKMGYQVEQTKLSGDQGADLVVVKFGEKKVIQAKRFGGKVGNKAVQEIMAAISLYQANQGMVITNNYFTPAAVELAKVNKIELIDREALEELINKHW